MEIEKFDELLKSSTVEQLGKLSALIKSEMESRSKSSGTEKKKVKILVNGIGDSRKGKRWMKLVTGIDNTKTNGFSIIGSFLEMESEHLLNENDIILMYGSVGSWKNSISVGAIFKVENGELVEIDRYNYHRNFITLREKIEELLKLKV